MAEKEAPYTQGLRRLLKIEREAEDRIQDAEAHGEEMITQAQREAGGIIGGTRTGANREADALIEDAKSEAEQSAQELLDDVESEIDAMRESAAENEADAVSLLVSWVTVASIS
jgi:V/A-type H+-transporting ATPase subunit G/H